MLNNILKIAHRGYSTSCKYTENTLSACYNAVNKGFDMIEIDVQLCKSNDIIVYHDTYINHNQKYFKIENLTYQELKAIKHNVITLDDVINNIDFTSNTNTNTNTNSNTQLYLDIKGNNNNIINPLLAKLESSYENLNNIILCSFNKNHINAINAYNSENNYTINHPKYIKKGFITENIFDIDDLNHLTQNIECLIFHWSMLDENTIKYCKTHNIKVFCYTCKNKHILKEMLEYDIDGIVSDILI